MKFRFRPWLALATALAVGATGALAAWQFDRAADKRALTAAARAGLAAAPVPLTPAAVPRRFQPTTMTGEFLADGEVLIDNRIRGRRPGYDAAAAFGLDDGTAVVVNRGWTAAHLDRTLPAIPPPPAGRATIRGAWIADQSDALELGNWLGRSDGERVETGGAGVRQNLKTAELGAAWGLTLRTTLALALAADSPGVLTGTERLPPTVTADFRAERSVAYAWQWLTFGALALVFFALLSRDGGNGQQRKEQRPGPGKTGNNGGGSPGRGGRVGGVGRVGGWPLLLILLIGTGTPLLSTGMYFLWRPASFTHYGELLSPPVPLSAAWRPTAGGRREWTGKWVLIRTGPAKCDGECARQLCRMRQLRLMMHGDYHRVGRAWLLTDEGAPPARLSTTTDCGEPRAAALRARAETADVLAGVELLQGGTDEALRPGWLHLADPNGLLVVRYPPGADLYQIRRDFRRLLKLSQRREF